MDNSVSPCGHPKMVSFFLLGPTSISLCTLYSDTARAGCPNTRHSMNGWCIYLDNALISRECKKKDRVSDAYPNGPPDCMGLGHC